MSGEKEEFEKKGEPDKLPLALRKTPRISAGTKPTSCGNTTRSSTKTSASSSNIVEDSTCNPKKRSSSTVRPDTSTSSAEKKLKKVRDEYCWTCHRDSTNVHCQVCPRSYHIRCLADQIEPPKVWICSECNLIMKAENVDTCSQTIKMLSLDQLCNLLRFTLHRMKTQVVSDEFMKPVSVEEFPNYVDYVCMPMDLDTLEKNIKAKVYGCTESFLADCKWILHNSIVFNGYRHRLTSVAKAMVKICKHEMNEIESCPDCYHNAYTKRDNWFLEPCRPPHLLIWAKLKGFPYWPAKAMKVSDGNVDVRFFGAHDRAWIPVSQCFLLSENIPTPLKNKKKGGFEQSMDELDQHIKRVKEKYGDFVYAPFRAKLEPDAVALYVKQMVPSADFNPKRQASKKRKTNSQSDTANVDKCEEKIEKENSDESKQSSSMETETCLDEKAQSKDAPSGVFEATKEFSPQMMVLDLHAPQIDVAKLTKTKHDDIDKMESTFEKIEEIASAVSSCNEEDDDKEMATANASDIASTSACEVQSEKPSSSQQENENSDHSCEVTSTNDCFLASPKVKDKFAEKLSITIASCKAKLGIDEVTEVEEDSEDSDDEDEEEGGEEEGDEEEGGGGEDVTPDPINADNEDCLAPVNSEMESIQKTPDQEHSADGSRHVPETNALDIGKPAVDFANILTGKDNQTAFKKNIEEDISDVKDVVATDGDVACESPPLQEKQSTTAIIDQSSNANTTDSGGNLKSEWESENKESKVDVRSSPQTKRPLSEMYDTDSNDYSHDENELVIDLDRREKKPKEKSENKRERKICKERAFSSVVPKASRPVSKASEDNDNMVLSERICTSFPESTLGNASLVKPLSPVVPRHDISQACPVKAMPPLQPCPAVVSIGAKSSSDITPCDVKKYSQKMVDFMRGTVEEMVRDMANTGNPEAVISSLQLEIERMQWRHQQEITELKHNTDLVLLEMRASMEAENRRCLVNARKQWEIEKQKAIDDTKKKQWCAKCKKEAIFYCCWNTSYCDYPCQQSHWPSHMSSCTQAQVNNDDDVHEVINEMEKDGTQLSKMQTRLLKKNEVNSGNGSNFDYAMPNRMTGLGDRSATTDYITQATSSNQHSSAFDQQVSYGTSQMSPAQRRSQMMYSPMRSSPATVPSSLNPANQGQGLTFSQRPLQLAGMMSPIIRSTHHSTHAYPLALPRSQQPRSLLPPNSHVQVQHSLSNFARHNLGHP